MPGKSGQPWPIFIVNNYSTNRHQVSLDVCLGPTLGVQRLVIPCGHMYVPKRAILMLPETVDSDEVEEWHHATTFLSATHIY